MNIAESSFELGTTKQTGSRKCFYEKKTTKAFLFLPVFSFYLLGKSLGISTQRNTCQLIYRYAEQFIRLT